MRVGVGELWEEILSFSGNVKLEWDNADEDYLFLCFNLKNILGLNAENIYMIFSSCLFIMF